MAGCGPGLRGALRAPASATSVVTPACPALGLLIPESIREQNPVSSVSLCAWCLWELGVPVSSVSP